jgi:uncharacterized protein
MVATPFGKFAGNYGAWAAGSRLCPKRNVFEFQWVGKITGGCAARGFAVLCASLKIHGDGKPMSLRDQLQTALKEAMKAKDAERLSALRLINAAIKDRDIANRGDGGEGTISDSDILAVLGRMVKQRQESARAYEEGGRLELAEKELAEIKVIEEFLPRQLTADEVEAAIAAAIAETGAASIRDMGRVIGLLKGKYTGQMDFGAVGTAVKARLG